MPVSSLPLIKCQKLEYFLGKTSESYKNYNFNGKTFEYARRLFIDNAMFLSFVLELCSDVEHSYCFDEIYLLKKHLSSWIEQFLIHESSRMFKAEDEFIFISKIKYPSQAINSLLSSNS